MSIRNASAYAAAIGTAIAVAASAAAAQTPTWQHIPATSFDNGLPIYAAGRLWFVSDDLRSAPVKDGRIGAWKTVALRSTTGRWVPKGMLGDALVYATTNDSDATWYSLALLPNGSVGPPQEIGGAPTPHYSQGSQIVQLPDRAVRIVFIENSRHEFAADAGVCCDAEGKAVNLASVTGGGIHGQLGLDRSGRLWFVWTGRRQGYKAQAKILELDSHTLRPVGAPTVVPGLTRGFADVRALLCSDICRVLLQGLAGKSMVNLSWAPGERKPTSVKLPVEQKLPYSNGAIIAAASDLRGLVVAYWSDHTQEGTRIAVARGDARGAHLRVVSSIVEPGSLGTRTRWMPLETGERGALGAEGFAAESIYRQGLGAHERAYVRVAILAAR